MFIFYIGRKPCFGDVKGQKSRGKSAKLSPQKAELPPGSPSQRELRSKETPEKMLPLRSGAERDVMLPCKEEPEQSCQIEDLPFMSTTEMYLCCWNQPPLSPLRETSPKKEEEVASEWTPHVVHDMLIVCKPNLYPIFNHFIHWMLSLRCLRIMRCCHASSSPVLEGESYRAPGGGPLLHPTWGQE